MSQSHKRLTLLQAEATKELYRECLKLSKERHEFGRLARRIGFCPKATKELWAARIPEGVKK